MLIKFLYSLPQSAMLTAADGGRLSLSLCDISLAQRKSLPSSEGAKNKIT